MKREIVLDTETTGLEPSQGHRITEIGCIELINHVPTGNNFHTYINPERELDEGAQRVTGLTYDFLKAHPVFNDIAHGFLDFIGQSPLVIHNAKFDMKFLNHELRLLNKTPIPFVRAIDTLAIARQKFPGSPASLDALCKRFNIDLSNRSLHGALLDADLLAQVYLELLGGRQTQIFGNVTAKTETKTASVSLTGVTNTVIREARPHPDLSEEELSNHEDFLKTIQNPIWNAR